MLSAVFNSATPLRCAWRATRFPSCYGWNRRWQHTASRAASNSVVALSAEVEHALAHGHPVVALESTIIAHGMPFPHNLATAQQVEAIVRDQQCTPATVAIMDGRIRVGLDANQLQQLAEKGPQAVKVSQRDLPFVLSDPQLTGATTVAATMDAAHRAGIAVFVTGGIGGVHRGVEQSWDISADLTELGRTPVAVVCSGTKSILDIPKTLEYLETVGVPVVTIGNSSQFPAFFTRDSGIQVPWHTSDPAQCAQWVHTQFDVLHSKAGMVVAVPIPTRHAADGQPIQKAIDQALQEANAVDIISTYELTPSTQPTERSSALSGRCSHLGLHTSNPGTTQTSIGGGELVTAVADMRILAHPHPSFATVFEPTSAPKSTKILRAWQSMATCHTALPLPAVDYATPDIHELVAMDAYLETMVPANPALYQSTALVDALSKVLHQHQVQLRLVQTIPTLVVKLGAKGVLILRRTSEYAPMAQATTCTNSGPSNPLRLWPIQLPHLASSCGFAYGIRTEETLAVWDLVGTLVAGLSQYYSLVGEKTSPVPLHVLAYLVDRGQKAAVMALQSPDPVSPKVDRHLLDDLPQLVH
ncbi:hypothetical protein H4R34_000104 [Dimargaris verticillata]|uniref:Indigoidine synthase A like protein-domain-containing protein n=1 Tax=Dimargaris verticillata TaxID=2761393 RepID=A0A9W8EC63_9FUNG|nr:hypothetical protein H4R34_000104 [Dimargaris verticillata]